MLKFDRSILSTGTGSIISKWWAQQWVGFLRWDLFTTLSFIQFIE